MNEEKQQSIAELNAEMVRSSRMRRDDAQTYRLDLAFLAGLVHGTPGMHATKKAALCDRLWRLSSHLEDAIDGSAEREAAEWRARYHHEEAMRGEDAAIGLAERERSKILTEERDTALRDLAEARELLRETNEKCHNAADLIDSMTASRTEADRVHDRWCAAMEKLCSLIETIGNDVLKREAAEVLRSLHERPATSAADAPRATEWTAEDQALTDAASADVFPF